VNGAALRRLFRRVLAKARGREDEAAGTRSLPVAIDGVPCLATFKVRLAVTSSSGRGRIDGECMAYLSCVDSDSFAAGFGWLRFGIAARSGWTDEPLESLFDWALRDARAELELRPEFLALRERATLAECAPALGARRARRNAI
jgi:hypothetical protein